CSGPRRSPPPPRPRPPRGGGPPPAPRPWAWPCPRPSPGRRLANRRRPPPGGGAGRVRWRGPSCPRPSDRRSPRRRSLPPLPNLLHERVEGEFGLLPGGHFLEPSAARLDLGAAEHDGEARPSLVGPGELARNLAAPQVHLRADAASARGPREFLRLLPALGVDEGEEEIRRMRGHALGVSEHEGDALHAHGETDRRRGGAAQHLHERVVAPASADRRLLALAEGGGGDLEGRAGVVVQTADQPPVQD